MTYEKAKFLFCKIENTKNIKLKNQFFQAAISYSNIRVQWYFANDDKRKEISEQRTRSHNVFIDSCNILSRDMIKKGEDANWRLDLGNDRKTIGDFACFVNCILGIISR